MISLEGLTLTHRPARRGRLHPAHLRPLRPRRPDPQPVPRRRERGALPHGRRDAVVLPRPRPLPRRHRRPRRRCGTLLPTLRDIVDHHLRGHALRHRRRSGRRPAAAGGRGLPAHLDGRQGRRLGGDAAARQGGRDQRPVVQRPAAAGGLAARGRATRRPADWPSTAERARASFNRALLVRARRATCTTSSTARQRRRPGLPAEPAPRHLAATTRCSTRRAGSRCWTWCASSC